MLSAGASVALSPQLDTTHRTLCIFTRDTAAIPTPVPGLVLSLMTLLPVSATTLCFKEHLTPGKWPVWTCVPFRRFYLDGALLHITGFHDDHHLNPNLNCLWELRCGGHYNRAPSLQGYYHNSDCVCSLQWRFCPHCFPTLYHLPIIGSFLLLLILFSVLLMFLFNINKCKCWVQRRAESCSQCVTVINC